MITAYFWRKGQVVTYSGFVEGSHIRGAHLINLYCVDMTVSNHVMRYGEFTKQGWRHVPLKEFPKEFLVMLLIMGVAHVPDE